MGEKLAPAFSEKCHQICCIYIGYERLLTLHFDRDAGIPMRTSGDAIDKIVFTCSRFLVFSFVCKRFVRIIIIIMIAEVVAYFITFELIPVSTYIMSHSDAYVQLHFDLTEIH